MLAVVDVGRRRGERARRLGGLLDEVDHAVVAVELDDPVLAREPEVADVADGDRAGNALAAPEVDVVLQVVVEEVVARDHDHVVVDDAGSLEREGDVADRAEPVVVRASSRRRGR